MSDRRIVVTSALPYANGHIHLGHLVEYIQTDIWVRFQKLRGHRCLYLCADDTHGTAIMIRARQEKRTEVEVIADMHAAHRRDFAGFEIEFDNYGSTNSPENRELCNQIWQSLRAAGMVHEEAVEQLFDPQAGTFLADRFVKGTCPKCGAADQYGDNCEKCSATYTPADLVNPYSTLTGSKPELRSAQHLFVAIEQQHEFLNAWTQSGEHLQDEIANYLKGHFLGEPLRNWDVSRPAPYFGFEIPDSPGNYWYVWFDAPIGYIASLWEWCKRNGEKLGDWWPRAQSAAPSPQPSPWQGEGAHATTDNSSPLWGEGRERGQANSTRTSEPSVTPPPAAIAQQSTPSPSPQPSPWQGEGAHATTGNPPSTTYPLPPSIHHFIGKDITYFHTLFWPAMLKTAGLQLPEQIHIHGFLTVGGEKMSKTRGTFVLASTYLKHFNPAYLRYYYASKLGPRLDDLDLNLEEFATKVNSDLVGKLVNLASRTARFVETTGLSKSYPDDGGLFAKAAAEGETIAAAYESLDYNKAMRSIMALADAANQYVDAQAPWTLRKDPNKAGQVQDVCTVTLNLFRQLAIYLSPVLPQAAERAAKLLNTTIQHWNDAQTPLVGTPVATFEPLLTRIDPKEIAAMIEESKTESAPATPAPTTNAYNDGPEPLAAEPLAPQCTIDEFTKIDLRVARVLAAEAIPEAKKLLKLTLSLGGDQTRTVFAGIKSKYKPEELVGRLVICVANLAPRQMKFGLSEGMVTAAGAGGEEIFLLSPDSGAKPGHRVH